MNESKVLYHAARAYAGHICPSCLLRRITPAPLGTDCALADVVNLQASFLVRSSVQEILTTILAPEGGTV
jgi:hypothetical protein